MSTPISSNGSYVTFQAINGYAGVKSDTVDLDKPRFIHPLSNGTMKIKHAGNEHIQVINVYDGQIPPILVNRVYETGGTTATFYFVD